MEQITLLVGGGGLSTRRTMQGGRTHGVPGRGLHKGVYLLEGGGGNLPWGFTVYTMN